MVTNWSICATEKGTRTETAPLTTIYSMRQLNLIWCPVEDVLLLFFFPPFISWEGNKSRANRRQHSITEHLVNLWNSPQEVASKSNASVGWFLWLLITAVAMQTKVIGQPNLWLEAFTFRVGSNCFCPVTGLIWRLFWNLLNSFHVFLVKVIIVTVLKYF